MCKKLNMAAEESLTPAALMDHNAEGAAAAAAAFDHNAAAAAATASNFDHNAATASNCNILQGCLSTITSHGQWESKLLIMAGPNCNSIDGSTTVINNDINPTDVDLSSPPIHGVLRRPLKKPALQLQVVADDHDPELVALHDHHADQSMSSITSCAQMQSPSKKLHARCSAEKEEEEEGDQEEEEEEEAEEGCTTPTGRDQRIPQYNQELNTSAGLACPPAPKKKPSASKRSRLFYTADDGAANYRIVAERRPFLVDPPDLHNFPDCIRALFK